VEGVCKDSAYPCLDDQRTKQKETLADEATAAFKAAAAAADKLAAEGKLEWEKYKATGIFHLAKLAPLGRLKLPIGGGNHCINAAKPNHGPSGGMMVGQTQQTEAWGVYPGGKSGNPGSKYYDSFVDQWAEGKYYLLWVMTADDKTAPRVKWKMTFSK